MHKNIRDCKGEVTFAPIPFNPALSANLLIVDCSEKEIE
jgi:hypothetical protein